MARIYKYGEGWAYEDSNINQEVEVIKGYIRLPKGAEVKKAYFSEKVVLANLVDDSYEITLDSVLPLAGLVKFLDDADKQTFANLIEKARNARRDASKVVLTEEEKIDKAIERLMAKKQRLANN